MIFQKRESVVRFWSPGKEEEGGNVINWQKYWQRWKVRNLIKRISEIEILDADENSLWLKIKTVPLVSGNQSSELRFLNQQPKFRVKRGCAPTCGTVDCKVTKAVQDAIIQKNDGDCQYLVKLVSAESGSKLPFTKRFEERYKKKFCTCRSNAENAEAELEQVALTLIFGRVGYREFRFFYSQSPD